MVHFRRKRRSVPRSRPARTLVFICGLYMGNERVRRASTPINASIYRSRTFSRPFVLLFRSLYYRGESFIKRNVDRVKLSPKIYTYVSIWLGDFVSDRCKIHVRRFSHEKFISAYLGTYRSLESLKFILVSPIRSFRIKSFNDNAVSMPVRKTNDLNAESTLVVGRNFLENLETSIVFFCHKNRINFFF